jgi:hypothetical protein
MSNWQYGAYDSDEKPTSLTMSGSNSGGSTKITRMYVIKQTLTPSSVGANTTAEQTFTVQGVQVGDSLDVNKPSHQVGLNIGNVRASAANQIAIQYVNTTASPITPTSETYTIGGMA